MKPSPKSVSRQRRRTHRQRLQVESLEDRRLLSVNPALAAEHPAYVPGELLIGLEGDAPLAWRNHGAQAALQAAGKQLPNLHSGKVLQHLPAKANRPEQVTTRWKLPPGLDVMDAIAQLSSQPGVLYAEPNYLLTASAVDPQSIPNDPSFNDLWGMHNTGQTGGLADADIDAPEAWSRHTGSGNLVVGVIDTGVNYTHPDLAANMWVNPGEIPGNGTDDDGNGYVDDIRGWDFVNNDNDPMDDNKHGTHVAGTIGASGDNGTGVVGVNWNVQIMPLKFLDNRGGGTTEHAILAVEYATKMRQLYDTSGGARGANIVLTNNSWGGGGYSTALSNAIAASGDENLLFVAAAGNTGGGSQYPAIYGHDNIISVAATDHNDELASFSSRGAGVDLAAPGDSILSTMRKNYGTLSGTSMASPHVAGVAALTWDRLNQGGRTTTYAEVRDILYSTVDVLPALADATATSGRVNAHRALVAADALLGDDSFVSVQDVSLLEGDGLTTLFSIPVVRTGNLSESLTVDWTSSLGTADATDVTLDAGSVTFNIGESSAAIQITVTGDTDPEEHETFHVSLVSAGTTFIMDGEAVVTILNDDTTLSISDAIAIEGSADMELVGTLVSEGAAGLNAAINIEYGPRDGNDDGRPDDLFVVSWNSREVLRFDAETGTSAEVFVPAGSGGINSPNNLRFGPDGNLYVADSNGHSIFRYHGTTGEPLPAPGKSGATFVSAEAGGLSGPRDVAFDSEGNLYVTSHNTDEVLTFQGPSGGTPGEPIGTFVTAASGGLDGPRHLEFGPDGHLYVNSYYTDAVMRYDGMTGAPLPAAGRVGAEFVAVGTGGLDVPWDIQFRDLDGSGIPDLFVSSSATQQVLRFDGASGDLVDVYVDAVGEVNEAYGLLFTPDGGLLLASAYTAKGVLQYSPASHATFTVALSHPVGQPISFDLTTIPIPGSADETDYQRIAKTFTMGPNATSLVVSVPTLDDADPEPTEMFTVQVSNVIGAVAGDLVGEATILDDDSEPTTPPGITVTPIAGLTTSEDGTSDSFTVVLDTPPSDTVTIGISTSDATEGTADKTSLIFTVGDWNLPQTVTVTGVNDNEADGNVTYAILTAAAVSADLNYSGLDADDVSVTNLDNDAPAGVTITGVTPGSATAGETINVTISGSGFVAGASVTLTGGSGPSPSVSNVVVAPDGMSITADVSVHRKAKVGTWDLVVTNPNGTSAVCLACFGVSSTVNGVTVASSDIASALAAIDLALAEFDPDPFDEI